MHTGLICVRDRACDPNGNSAILSGTFTQGSDHRQDNHTMAWFASLLSYLAGIFRSRASLQLENLALRHQLAVLRRTSPRRSIDPSPWQSLESWIVIEGSRSIDADEVFGMHRYIMSLAVL